MSLINDVLRDLQSRDRTALATHGLEAVGRERRWLRRVKLAGVFALGALATTAWVYFAQSEQAIGVKDLENTKASVAGTAARPMVSTVRDPGAVAELAPEATRRVAALAEPVPDARPKSAQAAKAPVDRLVESALEPAPIGDPGPEIRENLENAEALRDGASGNPPVRGAQRVQESTAAETSPPVKDSGPSARIQKTADTAHTRGERIRAQAQRFIRSGRLRQALPLLAQAAQLVPADESIYRLRAGVLQRLNQPVAADRALLQGLAAIPGNAALLEARARLHLAAGDVDGAIRALRADPEKIDTTPGLAGLLAGLLQRAHRFPEALEIYRKLELVEHTHPSWWLGLAISLEQTGDAEQAAAAYRSALAAGLNGPSQTYARERLAALVPTNQ